MVSEEEEQKWVETLMMLYGEGPAARGEFMRDMRLLQAQSRRMGLVTKVTTVTLVAGVISALGTAMWLGAVAWWKKETG